MWANLPNRIYVLCVYYNTQWLCVRNGLGAWMTVIHDDDVLIAIIVIHVQCVQYCVTRTLFVYINDTANRRCGFSLLFFYPVDKKIKTPIKRVPAAYRHQHVFVLKSNYRKTACYDGDSDLCVNIYIYIHNHVNI